MIDATASGREIAEELFRALDGLGHRHSQYAFPERHCVEAALDGIAAGWVRVAARAAGAQYRVEAEWRNAQRDGRIKILHGSWDGARWTWAPASYEGEAR